ncbi:MAG: ribonuclease III [Parcubacteria group bacterium]|nr:ribonuclease III [Parcubacteria group bacterium]
MAELSELEKKIGVEFKNKDLLLQALVHRSYLNENPNFKVKHNERLEFLGDAVLELVVSDYLYEQYPQEPEGQMTAWRAALVNANMLFDIAAKLGLGNYLLLSRGEAKDINKARMYLIANAFEALIGAIYLDQGIEAAQIFIEKNVLVELGRVIKEKLYRDSKSLFQEEAQDKAGITPIYEVLREWGPDHAKHFVIGVFLGDELVAQGEGMSKQSAQQEAAKEALKVKNWGS